MAQSDLRPATHLALLSRLQPVINLALAGLWLWLFLPVLRYLAVLFTREEFRTNQVVLLAVLGLLIYQVRQEKLHFCLGQRPRFFLPAVLLMTGSAVAFLLSEYFLDINTLSGLLFGLGSYGLVGLWMDPARWWAGAPAALLVIGVLPFGEHIETFVGYPVRRATAAVVGQGLHAAGVPSVGIDTILVFESGISQVDLPCSGVKSLWTGMLFLLAATWIENRRLGLRWLLAALVFAAGLLLANLLRVGALVAVGEVLGWRLAARMLHVPLGVLGFTACCALGWLLLRRLPARPASAQTGHSAPSFAWFSPALLVFTLAMLLLYTPKPQETAPAASYHWSFPSDLQTEPMPLSAEEKEWLTQGGADDAYRLRFNWQGVKGSMILVSSRSWRGQHRPERCFEVYGLLVQDSAARLVGSGFPLRELTLGPSGSMQRFTAAYWFQSERRVTDDFGTRIWADLSPQRERWVLVTLLFDDYSAISPGQVDSFYRLLRDTIANSLKGGNEL